MGSGKSSRCEALADAQRGHNTRCVGRVSVASVRLEKARLSGRECSHRRPTGDQDSLCRTGEDGKVKFWSGCLADIPLAGVGGKGEVVQPGGSCGVRREINTRESDG